MITRETKLQSLLNEHEEWIYVLLRFGLTCRAKDKTVGDMCRTSAFSEDLLLSVFNVLDDKDFRLRGDIQTYALLQLVDYHEKEDAFLGARIKTLCDKHPYLKPLQECYVLDADYRRERLYPDIVSLYEKYYSPAVRQKVEPADFAESSLDGIADALVSLRTSEMLSCLQTDVGSRMDDGSQAQLGELRRLLELRARLQVGLTKSIVRRMEKQLHSPMRKQTLFIRYRTHLSMRQGKSSVLSDRETECLALLSKGLTMKEIASKMGVQVTTALTHRKHLSEKLHLRTVAELVNYAINHKIC